MKQRIRQIIAHPLFSGSMVMIIGSNLTNVINYVYHLVIGRMLGPANYSELAVVISLIGLIGIIPASINPVVVKFISAAKNDAEIAGFINWFSKKIFVAALVITAIVVGSSPLISSFLNIKNPVIILVSGAIFLFLFSTVLNRGVLQGLLRFNQMVVTILVENGTKFLIGVALVYLGFTALGAVAGIAIAAFIAWVLTRIFVSDHYGKNSSSKPNVKAVVKFFFPVFFQSVALTSLYSSDLILVKHFFSPHEAGIYAAVSTLGKIIFFAAGPVAAVMFPLISKKQSLGQNYNRVFLYSVFLTTSLSLGILLIYQLFPKLTVGILYGSLYSDAASLLVWFGIFMTLFTLSSLLLNYFLSLGKVRVFILPLLAATFQVIGILLFHDSLRTVVNISIFATALLFISLLIYLSYANKINFSHSSSLQTGKNDC